MRITKVAVAGTLESSDVMIRVAPSESIDIELHSSVANQFGEAILETIHTVLKQLGVNAVQLIIDDKGALDCVLQARLKTALLRGSNETVQWEALL